MAFKIERDFHWPAWSRCLVLASLMVGVAGLAQTPPVRDLPYKTGATLTEYEQERCRLDVYQPTNRPFACLVWLHGGGLTEGSKEAKDVIGVARSLVAEGVGVVVPNYRLNPKVNYPAYVDDAVAAFAWTKAHIAEYGGDPGRVFLGGHSAGAYLSSIIGMDARRLAQCQLEPGAIAGLIPVSGQMMTHFLVRKERGQGMNTIVADESAPIYYTRSNTPPMLIVMGDRDWPGRLEENQYFAAMQRTVGNTNISLLVVTNRNHGSIVGRIPEANDPVRQSMLEFIRRR